MANSFALCRVVTEEDDSQRNGVWNHPADSQELRLNGGSTNSLTNSSRVERENQAELL